MTQSTLSKDQINRTIAEYLEPNPLEWEKVLSADLRGYWTVSKLGYWYKASDFNAPTGEFGVYKQKNEPCKMADSLSWLIKIMNELIPEGYHIYFGASNRRSVAVKYYTVSIRFDDLDIVHSCPSPEEAFGLTIVDIITKVKKGNVT